MIFDSSVKNVIISAYENETDVFLRMKPPCPHELFFDGIGTAVFMPGSFLCEENSLFYDIRQLADEDFRERLYEDNIKRLVVLFAECADKSEYGYREAFGWIGEMRAERTDYIQIVAFLSPSSDSSQVCGELFGCKDFICLGESKTSEFDVFRATSSKAKFYQTAALAEKYAFRRSAVYFNSREEAGSFRRFLEKRGTRCVYADGAQSREELKENVLKFASGEINILVATKSYIPTSYFYPPERVIFCGVPFSVSHFYRCIFPLKKEMPFVVYCSEDITRNEKIIASFSEKLADGEIASERLSRLHDMVKMLNIKE